VKVEVEVEVELEVELVVLVLDLDRVEMLHCKMSMPCTVSNCTSLAMQGAPFRTNVCTPHKRHKSRKLPTCILLAIQEALLRTILCTVQLSPLADLRSPPLIGLRKISFARGQTSRHDNCTSFHPHARIRIMHARTQIV
jgi:hypothetical protein